jgi:hypothetical protein
MLFEIEKSTTPVPFFSNAMTPAILDFKMTAKIDIFRLSRKLLQIKKSIPTPISRFFGLTNRMVISKWRPDARHIGFQVGHRKYVFCPADKALYRYFDNYELG